MLRLPTRPRRGLLTALTSLSALALLPLSAPSATATASTTTPTATPRTAAATSFGRTVNAELDSVIAKAMQAAGIPGVDVGLWIPGRGSYVRAFGVADKKTGAPMRTDMNFRIGSETETFTATVLLELVDHGRVHLDDPIDKYVPGVPDGGEITVRDLADMRSGLYPYENNKAFAKSLLAMPQQHFTPQQLLAYSFTHGMDFTPGTAWEYSDTPDLRPRTVRLQRLDRPRRHRPRIQHRCRLPPATACDVGDPRQHRQPVPGHAAGDAARRGRHERRHARQHLRHLALKARPGFMMLVCATLFVSKESAE